MKHSPVYFDHNATSPLDPRVLAAMRPWLEDHFGNPSSVHRWGQDAREAVEQARCQVARLLGVEPGTVVFTASGTEANNTAIFSSVAGVTDGHLVVSALEHPSVSRPIAELELRGFEVTRVRPDTRGVIDPDEVRAAVRPETRLVAVMLVNNELGTVQPVAEIGRLCRVAEVPLLCDAVQATGKMPLRATDLQADFVSVSAHKCNGPLGAAALIVDSASELAPRSWGGSQERRRRAGTENVPALVGMGQAAELIEIELTQRCEHLATLRDAFEEELLVAVHGVTILGRSAERVGNTTSLCISGVDAQALAIRLDLAGFAVSPGAACASGLVEPSATLLALGLDREAARGTLRISFGVTNRVDEVRRFVPSLIAAIESLRGTPARSLEEVRV